MFEICPSKTYMLGGRVDIASVCCCVERYLGHLKSPNFERQSAEAIGNDVCHFKGYWRYCVSSGYQAIENIVLMMTLLENPKVY